MKCQLKQTGLRGWLKELDLQQPKRPWLPDPNQQQTDSGNAHDFVIAKEAVEEVLDADEYARKQKRNHYQVYDAKTRATELVEKSLGLKVTKSTMQSNRNAYRKYMARKKSDQVAIVELPMHQTTWSSLYIGAELDAKVLTYLSAIRDNGGVVNRKITTTCALGVILENQPSLLTRARRESKSST